jgi:hypothetical protein
MIVSHDVFAEVFILFCLAINKKDSRMRGKKVAENSGTVRIQLPMSEFSTDELNCDVVDKARVPVKKLLVAGWRFWRLIWK